MHWFRSIAEALKQSPTRRAEAERLAAVSYGEVLAEQAVYGTPEAVAERLRALREELGFSSMSAWMNVGAQIPHERVLTSMRLFAERVAPRLA
jgi:alkanesulfonate monooxygenase SsuD/methylene tetrahydromethanopterin reductase-like flavin-dependent oxidoreductase (luciferase family)